MDDHVVKPVSRQTLAEAPERWLPPATAAETVPSPLKQA
jgi:hypothetical protein